jgi:hypothetical protein
MAQRPKSDYACAVCPRVCETTMSGGKNNNTASDLSEQENRMSKVTLLAGVALVLSLGACAKHSHKAPTVMVEPAPAPIYVEPVGGKGKYR